MIGLLNYNVFLYDRRLKLNMTRRQFAKAIGISWFHYYLIETGYVKPREKLSEKISYFLEEDFLQCMVGENSYSVELPDRKKNKLVKLFYNVLGSLWFRITSIVLFTIGFILLMSGIIINNNYRNKKVQFFSDKIINIQEGIVDDGRITFDLLNQSVRYEIFEVTDTEEEREYIAVKASPDINKIDYMEFHTTYWSDDYRITFIYKRGAIYTTYIDYIESEEYNLKFSITNTYSIKDFIPYNNTQSMPRSAMSLLDDRLEVFEEKLTTLIYNKLGIEIDFYTDIYQDYGNAMAKMQSINIVFYVCCISGIIMMLAFAFVFIFAMLFGTKNSIERVYETDNFALKIPKNIKLKTDIKITPFIPETLLEVTGIILIFFASLRLFYWISTIFGVSGLSINEVKTLDGDFRFVFFIGMFLLYFIDFESFLGDKRVIRNIFMYLFLFIGLYVIEMFVLDLIYSTGSIVYIGLIENITLPNMFFSISMYFLIIFFLYFTPKKINTKKRLIIFRSLSIIPVILIITFFIIFNLANTYFNWNLPRQVLYMFDSERIIFSILCITYLYSLYFLKGYYKIKHGTRRAEMFFNGNRFIFMKNILISIIIVIVALIDYLLKDNALANLLGFGKTYGIITLVPILLFYHPHKGQRNVVLDVLTTLLYVLALISFLIIFMFSGFGQVVL